MCTDWLSSLPYLVFGAIIRFLSSDQTIYCSEKFVENKKDVCIANDGIQTFQANTILFSYSAFERVTEKWTRLLYLAAHIWTPYYNGEWVVFLVKDPEIKGVE